MASEDKAEYLKEGEKAAAPKGSAELLKQLGPLDQEALQKALKAGKEQFSSMTTIPAQEGVPKASGSKLTLFDSGRDPGEGLEEPVGSRRSQEEHAGTVEKQEDGRTLLRVGLSEKDVGGPVRDILKDVPEPVVKTVEAMAEKLKELDQLVQQVGNGELKEKLGKIVGELRAISFGEHKGGGEKKADMPDGSMEHIYKGVKSPEETGELLTSAGVGAAKAIDKMGQHMTPEAIGEDFHHLVDGLAHALSSEVEQLGRKMQHMDLGSIVTDPLIAPAPEIVLSKNLFSIEEGRQALGKGWDSLVKATAERNEQSPIERGQGAGEVATVFIPLGGARALTAREMEVLGGAEKLGKLGEAELEALGLRRVAQDAGDLRMPEVPEHLKHLELQKASPELLDAMTSKGREIIICQPGTEELEYLTYRKLQGSAGGTDCMHILLKPECMKITALEEFLHGTQSKIGLLDRVAPEISEYRVKDFMMRHPKLLGLDQNDLSVLEVMREAEAERAIRRGYSPKLFEVGAHE